VPTIVVPPILPPNYVAPTPDLPTRPTPPQRPGGRDAIDPISGGRYSGDENNPGSNQPPLFTIDDGTPPKQNIDTPRYVAPVPDLPSVPAAPVPPILLLNVVQSVDVRTPLLDADADGMFKAIDGVVVLFVTELLKSVPLAPKVNETLVTVPTLHVLFADKSNVVPFMVSVLDEGTELLSSVILTHLPVAVPVT